MTVICHDVLRDGGRYQAHSHRCWFYPFVTSLLLLSRQSHAPRVSQGLGNALIHQVLKPPRIIRFASPGCMCSLVGLQWMISDFISPAHRHSHSLQLQHNKNLQPEKKWLPAASASLPCMRSVYMSDKRTLWNETVQHRLDVKWKPVLGHMAVEAEFMCLGRFYLKTECIMMLAK